MAFAFLLRAALGILLTVSASLATAADFLVDRWTAADGLPVNGINAIQRDANGYLWLATFGGLARFDGQRFTLFDRSRSAGLPSNRLIDLQIDANGDFWLFDENCNLLHFDGAAFGVMGTEQGLPGNRVCELLRRADGRIVVATDRGAAQQRGDRFGSVASHRIDSAVTRLFEANDGCLWIGDVRGRAFRVCGDAVTETYTLPGKGENLRVTGIAQGPAGELYVGNGFGIFRVHEGALVPIPGTEGHGSYGIVALADGTILFREVDRTLRLAPGATTAVPVEVTFTGHASRMAHVASNGEHWFNAGNTLEYDGRRVFEAHCGINDMSFDAVGAVWLATGCDGLVRLRPPRIATLAASDGIDPVYGLAQGRDGSLWVSARSHGIEQWRDGVLQRRLAPRVEGVDAIDAGGIGPDYMRTLFVDDDGSVFVGQHGVCRVTARGCERDPTLPDALQNEDVRAMFRDRSGDLWIGSQDHLWHHRNGQWDVIVNPGPSPRQSWVRTIAQQRDGTLWFGTVGAGLVRRARDGAFEFFGKSAGLSSESIRDIHEDGDGRLWIATEDHGVCRSSDPAVAPLRFACLDQAAGLYSDSLHRILEDDAGRLWFNSNQGVFWVARDALVDAFEGRRTRVHPRVYTERDGLPSAEGNGGVQGAGLSLADGRIAFPTMAGVAVFDPRAIETTDAAPRVVFEELTLPDGQVLPASQSAELPLGERDFALRYTGLSAALTNPLYFRYRLLPGQPQWQELGAGRQLRFAHLAPGDYRIELIAFDAASGGESPPAALQLRILPQAFEMRLFRYGLAALALALIALAYYLRQRTMRARQAALETQVAQRTADLREQQQHTEALLEDVSRQREEIEQLAAAKSQFFANANHELRTPLAVILGPLQDAARDGVLDPRRIDAMLRHGQRLKRLIDHMLDLERFDAGRFPLACAPLDVGAVVADGVQAFETLAQHGGIALSVDVAAEPLTIDGDEDQIARVVDNLLSNALKFTPRGGSVRVCAERHEGVVRLCVDDSGPGVPAPWRERIFDRFLQIGSDATRPHEGAGLGLALSREIIAAHAGQLRVEPGASGGACFIVELPWTGEALARNVPARRPVFEAARPAVAANASGPLATDLAAARLPRARVLVAEDDPDLRDYLLSVLAPQFDVYAAADGEEALRVAHERLPDVIVSDVVMPRLDGFALARALAADPELDGVPLIFLTARADRSDEIRGLDAGAVQYLHKPFDASVLLAHVRAALQWVGRLRRHYAQRAHEHAIHEAAEPASVVVPIDARAAGELALHMTAADPFVTRVIGWLETHLHQDDLDMDALASAVHVPRATLYRRFAAAAGESPASALHRLRLDRASHLLETGEGSVSEVAQAVGFPSLSAFSHAWRKRHGTAPTRHLCESAKT